MATISYLGKSGVTVNVDIADNNQGTSDNSKALYAAGYRNGRIDPNNLQPINLGSHRLYKDAAQAFIQMASKYKADTGKTLTVTDSYRPLQVQIDLILRKGWYKGEAPANTSQISGLAAQPGTSNHGWGLAVDIAGSDKFGTDTYNWLAANAKDFGFQRIQNDTKEPWHWEYMLKPLVKPITPANAPAQSTTTPTAAPTATTSTDTDGIDNYIINTYENVYATPSADLNAYNGSLKPYLYSERDVLLTREKLAGERKLLELLGNFKSKTDSTVSQVTKNISGFSVDAQLELVNNGLFSLDPDNMRTLMYQNSTSYDSEAGPDSAHAFRAPGKLAITATFTIPGMSGFRIAQVFWIDRISENYKTFGVFQVFGLTEHIDMSKGWTTEIYSRFNAIPVQHLSRLVDYTDGY